MKKFISYITFFMMIYALFFTYEAISYNSVYGDNWITESAIYCAIVIAFEFVAYFVIKMLNKKAEVNK